MKFARVITSPACVKDAYVGITAQMGFFDGTTFDHDQDSGRLNAQLQRVRDLMADGQWRTLAAISVATGDPESSVSARLRDLRKARFGQRTVDRRRKSRGLYEYRVV